MKSEVWYYSKALKPQGPVSREQMRSLIKQGEVGPFDLICDAGIDQWKPASEWGVFEATLFPAWQFCSQGTLSQNDEKNWVLLVTQEHGGILQEGPLSGVEIRKAIEEKRISTLQYVWKTGLSGWCQIKDRPEFSDLHLV